ncbi:heat shock factor-binding protein [Trifolium repens]|nr:heat shock factor-binding protein [Trifolium repens]
MRACHVRKTSDQGRPYKGFTTTVIVAPTALNKEVEVVVEQDVFIEVDESKDEKKETDEQDDSKKDNVDEGGGEDEWEIFGSLNQFLPNYILSKECFTTSPYSNIATYILLQPALQLFDIKPKDQALYQDKNSGSNSFEVEETDIGAGCAYRRICASSEEDELESKLLHPLSSSSSSSSSSPNLMDTGDSQDAKQTPADMTAFVQNLLQQMQSRFQTINVFLDTNALDDMGTRINELEQSINDLRAEMGVESSPSPAAPEKPKEEELKKEEGSD